MADVRVQLPLGAFEEGRGRKEVGKSSNVPIPPSTFLLNQLLVQSRQIGFLMIGSEDYLLLCGGSCVGTGRRLLPVESQVRFLPPQLIGL